MQIKQIVRRKPLSDLESVNLPPILQRIYAGRGITSNEQLEYSLAKLHNYHLLDGIEQAVILLYHYLIEDKKIVVVGDFDADGATSTALTVLALNKMGVYNVEYLIPDRFEHGYGLSIDVVKQAEKKQAELIITVDNGITSFAGIDYAHQQGIAVIVTDHHLQAETLPAADAIVNPNKNSCSFPSKALCGVGTAFYFMIALRAYLRKQNWFINNGLNDVNLAELLDLVALGTVADVVPLDLNNRILVQQGLKRIQANACRPGITALIDIANRVPSKITTSDLGFILAPRLNAAGRLDNMAIGVELLICSDPVQAKAYAKQLDELNAMRKNIEQGMREEVLTLFSQLEQNFKQLPSAIAIHNQDWHQGVIGILAARIKDHFYRPVVAFAPSENEQILKGSARSISGLHIKDVLEDIDMQHPKLIINFGGHAMAAGLTIERRHFEQFKYIFEQTVAQFAKPALFNNVILTDGELTCDEISINTAKLLRYAGPWGQDFLAPLFDGKFKLLRQQIIGQKHLKIWLETGLGEMMIEGIAFNINLSQWPDPSVKYVEIAYRLDINEFRGKQQLQFLVEYIQPVG